MENIVTLKRHLLFGRCLKWPSTFYGHYLLLRKSCSRIESAKIAFALSRLLLKSYSTCSLWLLAFFSILTPCSAQYVTLGANSCGLGQNNCHAKENDWWSADPHYLTNERFYNSTKSATIAKTYGISLDAAKLLDSVCMKCHATPTTADLAKKPVPESEYGVSCESCHGPGSGYKESHSAEKGKGYEIGVRFGMRRNKEMPVRAAMCMSCHFISNERLTNAGHPDGKKFDYDKGLKQVAKHFRTPDTPQERAAFLLAVNRGPSRAMVAITPPPKPPPLRTEVEPKKTTMPDDSAAAITIALPMIESPSTATATVFAPPAILMPYITPHKQLIVPPFPDLRNAKTRADSALALEQYLNVLLKLTR